MGDEPLEINQPSGLQCREQKKERLFECVVVVVVILKEWGMIIIMVIEKNKTDIIYLPKYLKTIQAGANYPLYKRGYSFREAWLIGTLSRSVIVYK